MSEYDDFYNVEFPLIMLVGLVTLPIWLPIWLFWYVFVGHKEEKNLPPITPIVVTPPQPRPPPKKPKFYNSEAEYKKFNP